MTIRVGRLILYALLAFTMAGADAVALALASDVEQAKREAAERHEELKRRVAERRKQREEEAAAAAAAAPTPAAPTAAAPTVAFDVNALKPNDAVEVREGDMWSPATFVKREGRKLQVRYGDGTEEWVTADRLRAPGSAAPAGPAAPAGTRPTTAPTTKPAVKEAFAIGAKVEVKRFQTWEAASVKNRDGDLYLIAYDDRPRQHSWEWAHPGIIRKVGSNKDWPDVGRGVTVGGRGITRSKEEARAEFASLGKPRAGAGVSARAAAPEPPVDPAQTELATFDKPITPAKHDGMQELLAGSAPPVLPKFDGAVHKLAERGYVLGTVKGSVGQLNMFFAGPRALIVKERARKEDTRRIELIDIAAGRSLGLINVDPRTTPLAVSPTGKRIAGRGTAATNRVDVYELKGAADPAHVISFQAYSDSAGINWAGFVDDGHVLTHSPGEGLILWDVAKAQALWRMTLLFGSRPALSPGHKQVAGMTEHGLLVVDALSGDSLCVIPAPRGNTPLTFTGDGKRVVGTSGSVVHYWDLAKGEFGGDIAVPVRASAWNRNVIPTADSRFVLVDGIDLLDLDRRLVVWEYHGKFMHQASGVGHGGRTFHLIYDGNRAVLLAAAIPHAAAKKAAEAIPPGAGLVLGPGGSVSIHVATEGTEEERRKAVEAFTDQLEKAGITVDPNSPVRLFARTEAGTTETKTYRVFGRAGEETVSSTQKITKVGFEHNGKVLWETSTVSGGWLPSMVSVRGDQSIGDALAQQNKYSASWLATVRVPTYLPAPSEKPWAGASRWTIQGVADDRKPAAPPPGIALAPPPKPAAPGDGLE